MINALKLVIHKECCMIQENLNSLQDWLWMDKIYKLTERGRNGNISRYKFSCLEWIQNYSWNEVLLNERKHFRLHPLVSVKGVTLITLSSRAACLHSHRPVPTPQSKLLGIELEAGRLFLLWGLLEHLDRHARQVSCYTRESSKQLIPPTGQERTVMLWVILCSSGGTAMCHSSRQADHKFTV